MLLYALVFAISLLVGAGVFGKEDLSHANIDWYFVAISFAGFFVFPSAAMWQARTSRLTPVLSPSFFRGFRGGWWSDPLQWLRISSLSIGAAFIGALITSKGANGQSEMAIYWKGSLALGYLLGEVLARKVFRKDIVNWS
ncbi:hypothetical protein ACXU4B_10945 [Dyella soli]|uniref:Uncharacterized protein n=1 Tax=Dyella soli TaxID=522319 RepID=A0A4R0YR30_9GAMM|nr:hypothetical protein [Dyella soli]TCI07311.1 hypothetical protein EZM97_32475 [Dyella soli]